MGEERRTARRFTIDHMVELELGRESVVHASGINLSGSGLLCKSDIYMEPETEVSLLLTIPSESGEHTVSCDGVVTRADKGKGRYLTAIHFTSLADKDVGALSAFLGSSLPA
ncbi:MAG TPA: PilZ domain-containing protein [Spirochaetia bacterium]|nr:PilZ domain-containing protein [Spirochaetia bacterium]